MAAARAGRRMGRRSVLPRPLSPSPAAVDAPMERSRAPGRGAMARRRGDRVAHVFVREGERRGKRKAEVATSATWTGDVAENRGGFGLGGYFARFG